jgi:DUF1680 family protein
MFMKKVTIKNILLAVCLLISICKYAYGQVPPLKDFSLSSVRLLEGPFYQAQQKDLEYILSLNEERLLVPFLREAGIQTKVESYGNWENTGLDGHMGGHYLTALAQMYASTGNQEAKRRLDVMVEQLAKCQEKNGNGYVGGIPGGLQTWNEIKQGKIDADNFSLNKKWVPLYNIHKLYAGLRDAYKIGGNTKARIVFIGLCNWFLNLTAGLSDSQIQYMLKSEHGGMNEVFADAAEMTGDKRYLALAMKLSHRVILNPLLQNKDSLTGLHANTQIPKVIGYKKIADLTGDAAWSEAANFFWKTVVENRTVSIGGNSVREHFHPASDFSSMIESNQGPETCNTYNMLRLSKALYLTNPTVKYIDYYERATYNHILSSQHPVRGGFVYFTPMRPRHYRVYSSPQESFWCCVGSGLENHGKYGELIYAHNGRDIFVNLFIPSQLDWKERGIRITQQTKFPLEESSTVTIDLKKSTELTLNIRTPGWVDRDKFQIHVNGEKINTNAASSSFVSINRKWNPGDVITITLPMHTTVEYLPSDSSWGSFMHGPIVLAAAVDSTDLKNIIADDSRMGHVAEGTFLPIDEAPMMVSNNKNFTTGIKRVEGMPLTFAATSSIYPKGYENIKLVPFYTIHDARYMIYWQLASPEKLEKIKTDLKRNETKKLELKAKTVDQVAVGEQQPETEHNYQGDSTEVGSTDGKTWRNSAGWFSYDFRNSQRKGKVIRVEYAGRGRNRKFDLIINDQYVKTIELDNSPSDNSFFGDYEIPANILNDSKDEKLTVKFVAHNNAMTGRIYHVRLMKAI